MRHSSQHRLRFLTIFKIFGITITAGILIGLYTIILPLYVDGELSSQSLLARVDTISIGAVLGIGAGLLFLTGLLLARLCIPGISKRDGMNLIDSVIALPYSLPAVVALLSLTALWLSTRPLFSTVNLFGITCITVLLFILFRLLIHRYAKTWPRDVMAAIGLGGAAWLVIFYLSKRVMRLSFLTKPEQAFNARLILLVIIVLVSTIFLIIRAKRIIPVISMPLVLLITLGVLQLGSFGTIPVNPDQLKKNVIIIGIDTFRHDYTTLPGMGVRSALPVTPNLERMAGKGTVFCNAVSQSSWTLTAFASIITGLYPFEHKAQDLFDKLPGKCETLAERLHQLGYETGAVISHVFLGIHHGMAQGYDYFNNENSTDHREVTSQGVTDRAIEFLEKRDPDRPFFLFVHYFDPHYNYVNHKQYPWADDYSGWLDSTELEIGNILTHRQALEQKDVEHLTRIYSEEIAYTDAQIGRLFDALRQQHLEQSTGIVVVGDHGEEFMERGYVGHGISMYEEVIHVPLVITLPGDSPLPKRVQRPVETKDIFPTVLEWVGSADAGETGRSLLHTSDQDSQVFVFSSVWRPHMPVTEGKRVRMAAAQSSRWKIIFDYKHDKELFFDLTSDPLERVDVSGRFPGARAMMADTLSSWLEQMGIGKHGSTTLRKKRTLSPEELKKLKSLGYF